MSKTPISSTEDYSKGYAAANCKNPKFNEKEWTYKTMNSLPLTHKKTKLWS